MPDFLAGSPTTSAEPSLARVLASLRSPQFSRIGGRKAMLAHIDTLDAAIAELAELATPEGQQRTVNEMNGKIDHLKKAVIEADLLRRTAEDAADAAVSQAAETEQRLAEMHADLVITEDAVMLQEVGVYEYRHPMEDSDAYAQRLKNVRVDMKQAVRNKTAVTATTNQWTVDGSEARGRKMINDTSKLLLRAYNNEASVLVDKMRPYRLDASLDKLEQSRRVIERLGEKPMKIAISDKYHRNRRKELELVADWLAMKQQEKEEAKAERERLREEAKARKEIEAEQARLRKEQAHYEQTLQTLRDSGASTEAIAEIEAQLNEVAKAVENVDYRAANIRAGYVYVISNVGSFGKRMVKIGMTRRLEPMDRVKELGDASVPFGYDLHALVFAEDAVDLETRLHQHFADSRVNLVNLRREFFYATPEDVRDALPGMGLSSVVTEFHTEALAEEWNTSESTRQHTADSS